MKKKWYVLINFFYGRKKKWYVAINFVLYSKVTYCHKFYFIKKIFIFVIILNFMDKDNYLQKLLSTTPTMEPSIQIWWENGTHVHF